MLVRSAVDNNLILIAASVQSARPNPAYVEKLARELRRHIRQLRRFAASNPKTTIAECIRQEADSVETRLGCALKV